MRDCISLDRIIMCEIHLIKSRICNDSFRCYISGIAFAENEII